MKSPTTLAEACSEMYNDSDRLSQCSFYIGAMKAVEIMMYQGHGDAKITAAVARSLVDEVARWLETRLTDARY